VWTISYIVFGQTVSFFSSGTVLNHWRKVGGRCGDVQHGCNRDVIWTHSEVLWQSLPFLRYGLVVVGEVEGRIGEGVAQVCGSVEINKPVGEA
jgi:hypothetical protein